jgi:DNA mismatch endonuclease (patch repair protein)
VRRTDGRAEVALRKALWTLGLRYRKNVTTLPGKPDIVFQKMRVAIFIDGDFWHGRDWDARLAKLRRGSNAPYWVAKINANMERDKRKTAELQADGWTVLRVWETDVVRAPSEVAERIASGWLRGLGFPAENSRGRPGSK